MKPKSRAAPSRPARNALAFAAALALAGCAAPPAAQDRFEPLQGADAARTLESHRWRLDAAADAAGRRIDALFPAGTGAFALTFQSAQVVVDGRCNTMRGGYELAADGRLVMGRLAATMKACEPALMQADAALAKLLGAPLRADVAPGAAPKLRLVTPASESLVLAGELTPEARYGPPTVVFLEVAARRVPCAHPSGETTCLQVRDRFFDAQGLPAGPAGEWRVLQATIAGYTHREGERNVIRVKRFQRANAPADAASPVYVLDLVVETEIVKP